MQTKISINFLTGLLDSRIAFARTGSTATRINSAGSLETVSADTPRFDYDPTTLACKGLLLEESRANLLGNNTMAGAVAGTPGTLPTNWSSSSGGLTQEIIGTGSENGIEYIDIKFSGTTTANNFFIRVQNTGGQIVTNSSQPVAFTTYIKLAAGSLTNVSTTRFVWDEFNSGGGYVTSKTGNFTTTEILDRKTLIENTASTTYRINPYLQFQCSVGVAIDVTFRIGLPQVELGAFATSVIKTSSGSLTRNADVAMISGSNFDFWRSTQGGVVARALPSTASGTRPIIQFDDNTADNVIALRGNTTNPELYIKATTDQAQIDAGTISANTVYKLGATWATDNCAANLNGGAPILDGSATIPTVTQARLGSDGTNYLNGHIQSIEYYDQRILNSGLQILSGQAGFRSVFNPILNSGIIK